MGVFEITNLHFKKHQPSERGQTQVECFLYPEYSIFFNHWWKCWSQKLRLPIIAKLEI